MFPLGRKEGLSPLFSSNEGRSKTSYPPTKAPLRCRAQYQIRSVRLEFQFPSPVPGWF